MLESIVFCCFFFGLFVYFALFCLLLLLLLFVFVLLLLLFKVETSSRTLIPLLRPGSVHSGSASCDDCGCVLPDELHVGSFLDRLLHYAWTAA